MITVEYVKGQNLQIGEKVVAERVEGKCEVYHFVDAGYVDDVDTVFLAKTQPYWDSSPVIFFADELSDLRRQRQLPDVTVSYVQELVDGISVNNPVTVKVRGLPEAEGHFRGAGLDCVHVEYSDPEPHVVWHKVVDLETFGPALLRWLPDEDLVDRASIREAMRVRYGGE